MLSQDHEMFICLGILERFNYGRYAGRTRDYVGVLPQSAIERIAGMNFSDAKYAALAYRNGWQQGESIVKTSMSAIPVIRKELNNKIKFYFK